jgi:hypothetical protein
VRVNHAADVEEFHGEVLYTLDAQLRPVSVDLSDGFERAAAALVRRKLIPPPPASPAIEQVRTIRWWDGARFLELRTPASAPDAARVR